MAYGSRLMVAPGWLRAYGSGLMAQGSWRLRAGSWLMAQGSWWLRAGGSGPTHGSWWLRADGSRLLVTADPCGPGIARVATRSSTGGLHGSRLPQTRRVSFGRR